jgi:hypothetical protein
MRAPSLLSVLLLAACGKPIGAEGGPCTEGGACDAGLTCASDLCVRLPGEGEGEGECRGDEAARNDRDDCASIPTSVCAAFDDNAAVQTCDLAGAILRSGLFQAAYECIADIPPSRCGNLRPSLEACFEALTACPLQAAADLCAQAGDTCVEEGDNGFDLERCTADLTSTNFAFRSAWADCFNSSAGVPCSDVHDSCYNVAINTLVGD